MAKASAIAGYTSRGGTPGKAIRTRIRRRLTRALVNLPARTPAAAQEKFSFSPKKNQFETFPKVVELVSISESGSLWVPNPV